MQRFIDNSLESNWLWLTARICLALVFVASGLAKLFDYQASLEEMRAAGLEPAWLFNIATAITLLAGSALVLLDRKLWLGAGALAVFLLLTILIVHTFWSKTGVEAKLAMFFALEHIAVIGGLIATAIASALRQRLRQETPVAATYQKA
ncbi:DoxX family protein [Pseudomonas aeruginosa]|uniref:multidrug efflux RND transporter inhibitory subunit MexG n=1 Tax=Pseudomonas aeruginosa group TaxID=136841 RepID=UPI00071B3007|nr:MULTISPECIES: multidrug efflux RND transporter inhibitory subunit MexG [Pseudomonas aeruginosa group]KSP93199.1 DoxX family protein [Pseudomonas aeruginosa]MCW8019283.1 multidrug efflux RND transporter inhibitory subunit MexG [Pseudomonas aeruginosa]RTT36306.1 multidrug efflux RND transporter inhibitory subunit MexG [Pseudomonas paraeruginosa]